MQQEKTDETIQPKLTEAAVCIQEPEGQRQPLSLDDADELIQTSLKSAARSVIAVGYYLKYIRDHELYREAGCENIWDYARKKYGFSASNTSRYMKRNDKFSKDGNSPLLDEQFREYNKSQLQEMLSLDDDEMQAVTPDMTVRQIREIHKPREIPYIEIPGQLSIEDFPDLSPESFENGENPDDALTAAVQAGQDTITVEDLCESKSGNNPEESVATSQEAFIPEKTGRCLYRPDFMCTLADEDKRIPGDGIDCTHKCCWDCPEHGNCRVECYSSSQRPDAAAAQQNEEECCGDAAEKEIRWKEEGRAWEQRRIYCNAAAKHLIRSAYDWMREDVQNRVSDVIQSEKELKKEFRPNGSTWYFQDPEIEMTVAHMNLFEDYIQFWNGNCEWIGDCEWFYLCASVQAIWNDAALEIAKLRHAPEKEEEPDTEKELFDEDFCIYNRNILEKMILNVTETLQVMGSFWKENMPNALSEHTMMKNAYQLYLETKENEKDAEEEQEETGQQPELPAFRNNDERKAWLSRYQDWGLWYEDENIGAKYYKYDFPDGSRIIVDEYENSIDAGGKTKKFISSYLHLVGGPKERPKLKYGVPKYPYHERYSRYPDSETEMVEFLKAQQRRAK